MAFRKQLALTLAMLTISTNILAYTEVRSTLRAMEPPTRVAPAQAAVASTQTFNNRIQINAANNTSIASNLKYRGRTISGNQVGFSSETTVTADRAANYAFLSGDIYSYNSNLPRSGPGIITDFASPGGVMTGASIGAGRFFNTAKSTFIQISHAIYQWPDQYWLEWTGNPNEPSLQDLNSVTGAAQSVKPVKTTDIQVAWRNFSILYSIAHASDAPINPNNNGTKWPHNWGNYVAFETPKFQFANNISTNAHASYWDHTGTELFFDLNYQMNKNIIATARTYTFSSKDDYEDDNWGMIARLQFTLSETLHGS